MAVADCAGAMVRHGCAPPAALRPFDEPGLLQLGFLYHRARLVNMGISTRAATATSTRWTM